MFRHLRLLFLTTVVGLAGLPQAIGAIVTFESQIRADFTFTATAAGQAAFGAPAGVPLPLRALGQMSFSIDDDGTSTTVPFTDATGQLPGVTPPTPANFLPFYITPVRFDGGSLTNITRDGSGRIVSGTVTNLAMPWEMVGTGANDGVFLYGDQATTPLLFNGDISIDHSGATPKLTMGSQISGLDPFNIYLFQSGDRANQLPGTDPLVFVGGNRFLTAVPEPSVAAFGFIAFAIGLTRRRRMVS